MVIGFSATLPLFNLKLANGHSSADRIQSERAGRLI